MSEVTADEDACISRRQWLWDHAGRLAGTVVTILVVAFLAFLAFAGYEPAIGLIVVLVVGFFLIALGGRIRGE